MKNWAKSDKIRKERQVNKGQLGGDTFLCIEVSISFSLVIEPDSQYIMLLWEGCQSSAQRACYLPSLGPSNHLCTWVERSKMQSALLKDTTYRPTWGSNLQPWNPESGALLLSYTFQLWNLLWVMRKIGAFLWYQNLQKKVPESGAPDS